jgi:hypothetical protein
MLVFSSYGTLGLYLKTQKDLDLSIKTYNLGFESKAIDRTAPFVHPVHRAEYMEKLLALTKRLTIFDSTILDIKFFNNGVKTSIRPK